MKLTSHRRFGWRTSCLHGLVVFLGLVAAAIVPAQENKPADATGKPATVPDDLRPSTPTKPDADAKLPDAIHALMPSIVTVTRIGQPDGDPANQPVTQTGVVVDSSGYIAIAMLPGPAKLFLVRFANQPVAMGELVAIDETLKVGLLKIERPLPVKAVSLNKAREARRDERVLLVPSSASKEMRSGRVLTNAFELGEGGSTKLIQADIACPLSEFGCLMVSEAGEPIGLVLASRSDPQPMSVALPMKVIRSILQAAIDKPKDVPLVRVDQSQPDIDLARPVPITLQPITPLAKSMVEIFAPRGAKILEHEEGKRLKIEAPPVVLEELGNLLALVASEEKKEAEVFDANKLLKIKLQPATPLAKSLVELFAKRGAKVLDYEEGKRLQIEAPPKAMEDLGKILEIVGRESQRNDGKTEANTDSSLDLLAAPALPAAHTQMPDISGQWTYNPPPPAPEDVNRDLIAPPQDFVVRRSTQAGVDFEYLGTLGPALAPRKLKWEPGSRRFRMVSTDGTVQQKSTFELSPDGNQLSVRILLMDADHAKRLAAKGAVTENAFTERYLTQQFRRVGSPEFADDSREALSDVVGSQSQKNEVATKPGTPPTKTVVPQPIGDSSMPDITGTWRVQFLTPIKNPNSHLHFEIRRVQQGKTDFLIDMPWVKEFSRFAVTWSAARQRFEGEFNEEDDQNRSPVTLQPQADRNSLRVIITNRIPSKAKQPNPADTNSDKTEEYVTQIWTRTSMTLATTYPAEEFGQPEATPLAVSPTQAAMLGANRGTGAITPKDVAPQSSAVPNTPAAKQLVEQLEAQESAAVSAATEIRRLQANGDAVENIVPHQVQLKGHLQTAFELKMQLEDLQVKELHARLSQLERQIGQRKELREKIINRRAAELIEGDSLTWNTKGSTAVREAETGVPK